MGPNNYVEFPLSKNQTKWPIQLWTLKQEMETDEDHATTRASFLLVQNILFIEYTEVFPNHVYDGLDLLADIVSTQIYA